MDHAMRIVFAGLLLAADCSGQCAMCFRNAEAQTRARAEVFNRGIVVISVPLAAACGAIGWLAYSRRARRI
jgi:hypothetical protein